MDNQRNNDPLNIFNYKEEKLPDSTREIKVISNSNDKVQKISDNGIQENPLFHINNDQNEPKEELKKEKTSIIRKPFAILLISIFILVCILTIKTFAYGNQINEYQEVFIKIEKKNEESITVYEGKQIDSEILKKVAATELIKCINSKIETDKLPDNIKNIIKSINDYYNSSINNFAYTYKDIYTGFTVSYNANQNIFSASSIKAPKDIYIYEMASQGKINLDEKLTYTSNYYNTGSGVLKNKPVNTSYTVRKLIEYSTIDSDNAAHNMLMDKYGRENMLKFWQAKGTTGIFTQNTNWGVTNAHDATIYMEELYRFYTSNDEYGTPLMNNFMKSYPKFIKGKNNYLVASKSGWAGSALHEMAIIFAENPYIVIGLSNLGDKEYQSYFNKINDLSYNLHQEYWKYKMETCKNIKQY